MAHRSSVRSRGTEDRLRTLAARAPVGIFETDASGDCVYVNERWCEIVGLSPEQAAGRGWLTAIHPDDRARAAADWYAAARAGREHATELRLRTPDGGVRRVAGRATPHRDETGRVLGFVGTVVDITERNEAERGEQLRREREARERAEAAMQLLARVQAIADAALGSLSVDELLGDLLARVRSVLGTDTAVILLREGDVLRVRDALGLEAETQHQVRVPIGQGFAGRIAAERHPIVLEEVAHGTVVSGYIGEKGIHSLAGVPLEREGRTIGVLHVGSIRPKRFTDDDVRVLQLAAERIAVAIERAAAHDAEREARAAAEAASRAKDEFLSVVSHELRTPLASMTNWLRVLRTDKGPLAARAIESIDRSARAQAKLIEDLLDVSRIVAGHLRLDLRPVDFPPVIRGALDTISPTAEAKGVRVVSHLDTAPTVVAGDPDRLQQIAVNLVANAVKFTPAAGIVEVRLEAIDRDVRLIVRDTGQGIPAEFLPYVFEPFRQAEPALTRRHGGLGLGLAIVRYLVELHGGTVGVESAGEGQGATFTVTLPLLTERVAVTDHGAVGAVRQETLPRLDGLRVLVVDDDPETCELLRHTLEGCGATVTMACSAGEAREALDHAKLDVLVSDVRLPDGDGYALLRELRARADRLPAVAVTAFFAEEDRGRALAAGYGAHLAKPVEPRDLVAAIAELTSSPVAN